MDLAQRAAREAGSYGKVALLEPATPTNWQNLFPVARSSNSVHNVMEYLDERLAVFCGAARALRRIHQRSVSPLRNRAGEVLKAAIPAGELAVRTNTLTAEWDKSICTGGRCD